jgi:hypothetical protein
VRLMCLRSIVRKITGDGNYWTNEDYELLAQPISYRNFGCPTLPAFFAGGVGSPVGLSC